MFVLYVRRDPIIRDHTEVSFHELVQINHMTVTVQRPFFLSLLKSFSFWGSALLLSFDYAVILLFIHKKYLTLFLYVFFLKKYGERIKLIKLEISNIHFLFYY